MTVTVIMLFIDVYVISGDCQGFECSRVGTKRCDRSLGQDLCNDQHFCIDESMKCNEVPNCGASDDSDENKCQCNIKHLTLNIYHCLSIFFFSQVIFLCMDYLFMSF